MSLMRKLLSSILAFNLLFTPVIVSAQNISASVPLSTIQKQAQTDWASFHEKYGSKTTKIFNSVLADAPYIIILYQQKLKTLETELDAVKKVNTELSAENVGLVEQNIRFSEKLSDVAAAKNKVRLDFPPYLSETLSAEEKNLFKQTLKENSFAIYDEVVQNSFGEFAFAYDKEMVPLLTAIQKSDRKKALSALNSAFPDAPVAYRYSALIPFDEHQVRRQIVEQMCADVDLFSQTKLGRFELTKGYMKQLNTLFIHGKRPSKMFAKNIARYIMARSGLLSIGLVILGGTLLVTSIPATAAEREQAQELIQYPELFIDASPNQLAEIEKNKLAAETARQIAEILHAANQLPQEDIQLLLQNQEQERQGRLGKKEIIKELQTVKAY